MPQDMNVTYDNNRDFLMAAQGGKVLHLRDLWERTKCGQLFMSGTIIPFPGVYPKCKKCFPPTKVEKETGKMENERRTYVIACEDYDRYEVVRCSSQEALDREVNRFIYENMYEGDEMEVLVYRVDALTTYVPFRRFECGEWETP